MSDTLGKILDKALKRSVRYIGSPVELYQRERIATLEARVKEAEKRNLSLIKELEKALREGKELEGKLAEAMGTMADLFQYIHPNDARQKAEEFWERWAEKKFSESGKQ